MIYIVLYYTTVFSRIEDASSIVIFSISLRLLFGGVLYLKASSIAKMAKSYFHTPYLDKNYW